MNWKKVKVVFALLPFALALTVGIYMASCDQELDNTLSGPLTFEVKIASGDRGSGSAPIAFSNEPLDFTLDIRAIDEDGSTADWFNGEVHIDLAPTGNFPKRQERYVQLKNGVATGFEVQVENIHGRAHIWIEDSGTEEKPGSYATGLSEAIWVENPTIHQVQVTDRILLSPLEGDFVEIYVEDHELVVTGVTNDGFYVTDLNDNDKGFNGIFVYNYSRPPGITEGDRILQLNGTVVEHYGFTELSFPAWKEADTTLPEPTPTLLTSQLLADEIALESLESAFVEIDNVKVCGVREDFSVYGQWAVVLSTGVCPDVNDRYDDGSDAINVVSYFTIPDFDPTAYEGQTLARLRGNLRYHGVAHPSWMIYTRGPEDILVSKYSWF